ncbi:MAG: Helix-hairpin-helix motif protein [bacterium ADurb.BinA186]|nr:MAG: Helix-hairpin-helix motif protein [bacterium ADurb.BinA186]
MRLSDWIFLCAFVSLGTLMSFLPKVSTSQTHIDLCLSGAKSDIRSSYSKVCGKKIKLREASVNDFASIDGISIKKARRLVEAINNAKNIDFNELLNIKGIGPKSLARLEQHFEP